jgi:uncharacterized membrane protein YedE/YeeE
MATITQPSGVTDQELPVRAQDGDEEVRKWPWIQGDARTLAIGALSGSIFGFLLQKGGAASFDILLGVLLLESFVVMKIMLSAITAGMLIFHLLARRGMVEPKIQDAAYGSNIIGGLVFGVGFALLAYCPGTDLAAVGQGNLDALVGIAGLVLGSYLFALTSRRWELTSLGKRGKLTLPDVLHMPRGAVVAFAVLLLLGVLALLETAAPSSR